MDSLTTVRGMDRTNGNMYQKSTIIANDSPAFNPYLGADNTGTVSTGAFRIGAGFEWGNALSRGGNLTYRFTVSPDLFRYREHEVTYTTSLPWNHTLTLSGSLTDTNARTPSRDRTIGNLVSISARYGIPLPGEGFTSKVAFGYDFKRTNNNVLFGGVNVFPTTSVINQFVAEYTFRRSGDFGSTDATILLVASPGGLSTLNNDAAFSAEQAGAGARYAYVLLTVDRSVRLPGEMSISTRLNAQWASTTLLPSEQLTFGGVQSIRGFIEDGATRDNGVLLQTELHGPPVETGMSRLFKLNPDTLSHPLIFIP